MLTDHWVIAQLLAQACTLALMAKASLHAWRLLRRWDPSSYHEGQLRLERQSYLVAAIARLSLAFQLLVLLLFLATVNLHLPGMLKGAMCATGVLALNPIGYPLLALKAGSALAYWAFLVLDHWDSQEPSYPLTPGKYRWALLAMPLLLADFGLSAAYFQQLSPNIIATCCSVAFSPAQGTALLSAQRPELALGAFAALGLGLGLAWLRGAHPWLLLALTAGFVAAAITSLKLFFVKYIYGLPSHACLFDIFWGRYGYIGYLLFGSYYVLGGTALARALLHAYGQALGKPGAPRQRMLMRWALGALAIALIVPALYWALWPGSL
jgi:hypothetical protein